MDDKTQQLVKVPRKVTRDLPVKLSESEMAATAKEIGRLNRERATMEANAKVSASQWKDRISGFDAQISDLATKADVGQENRPVECEEVFDYRLGEVRVQRLDTHEQLEVRPMTTDERQPNLPAIPKPPEKAPKEPKLVKPGLSTAQNDATDPDAPPTAAAEIKEPQKVLDADKKSPPTEK